MSSEKKEDICHRPDCNWVLVSKETMSYVCLRCGKKWPLPKEPGPKPKPGPPQSVIFLMALAVALAISLIMSSTESQPDRRTHWHYDSWPDRY